MEQNNIGIFLIIVLFHPNEADLRYFEQLGQVYSGYIIDNSEEAAAGLSPGKLEYICNHKNLGIAEAQNIGMHKALNNPAFTHVVFFDQDTRVDNSYPAIIVSEFIAIHQTFPNLAVLGPTVKHLGSGEEYKSVIHKDHFIGNRFIQRREVISSGCCISRENLERIGLNDSRLFIDFVDFEWCWRAEHAGYLCGITTEVHILHKVGRRELRFPFGYRVIISAPVRYYYQYRNFLWLFRKKYVPWRWKIATGVKYLAHLLYFPLFVHGGSERASYMLKGIKAGLKK